MSLCNVSRRHRYVDHVAYLRGYYTANNRTMRGYKASEDSLRCETL